MHQEVVVVVVVVLVEFPVVALVTPIASVDESLDDDDADADELLSGADMW